MTAPPAVSAELADLGFPWAVEQPLGRGATSAVFAARAEQQVVALKVCLERRHERALLDEAERGIVAACASLPRVLGVGRVPPRTPGLGDHAGAVFVAQELAPGSPVEVRRARARRELALVLARDVGDALAELHALGFAHGDIKPANVLVEPGVRRPERAHVVDFGLGDDAESTTARGGTPRYLAPEVLRAPARSSGRARDLWALGVLLAEAASEDVARADDVALAAGSVTLPAGVDEIVRALLSEAPAARPSASWVAARARAAIGSTESEDARQARARRVVQRAYLAARRHELAAVSAGRTPQIGVEGVAASWLRAVCEPLARLAALRGTRGGEAIELGPLDEVGRGRFLVGLVGSSAAHFPPLSLRSDGKLVDRLLALCEVADPAGFTYAAIEQGTITAPAPSDAVTMAALLVGGDVSAEVLDAAERMTRQGEGGAPLAELVGRTLRARGEWGRALTVLQQVDSERARVDAAEVLRRSGDADGARRLLDACADDESAVGERVRAVRARLDLDAGNANDALGRLTAAPSTALGGEVRALCELAVGRRREARLVAGAALSLAECDEERARLHAVLGNVAHGAGDAEGAMARFRRAVEHAALGGAVLEEATYLTGLAAAAATVGALGEALDAGRRAVLLFEHLGRDGDAARAQLSRASVFASLLSVEEARDAVDDAIRRARAAGDDACRAYAHLALADALPDGDHEGAEHAERARQLLSEPSADDRLRVGARLLRRGAVVDSAELDALARRGELALDARLDWWAERARGLVQREATTRADEVLSELAALTAVRAPLTVRGPAAAAAAELAARVGDGEAVRRFALVVREVARELSERATPALRERLATLPWVRSVASPREERLAPEQVADIEALVRALGTRDRLRPLLDQVLDALVLWTGVERGLLLLRAPGGRLAPRAARNLARRDLTGEQLHLSRTLAERALERREPVVAVDAAGEMQDVHASVQALRLRSVLAVPLLARGEALGVVYLDDRVRRGAFGPRELSWVRLVAVLAAVAIADARDQIMLRRAARRARRAEARLAEQLAAREAALDVAERELARQRRGRDTRFEYPELIGQSEPLRAMLRLVDRVAVADVPVLVVGESGSGKELVARAIHEHSSRAKAPFVSENCGAIPEGLLESALFGHVRGAFTGASRPRAGLFEVADEGTLFLDEIGEMSLPMQTKLLRVLEDGVVRAVGSERGRKVDVRVIGATHRDLDELVKAGRFREDLLFRLNVISVRVPPLRERSSDIPLLVRHFVSKHATRAVEFTAAATTALCAYAWPGNVRQLENEVRRALVLADDAVDVEHLSRDVRAAEGGAPRDELDLRARVDALEKDLVETALDRTDGNQTRAAELLGLSRYGLQKMIKRLGVRLSGRPSQGAVGRPR